MANEDGTSKIGAPTRNRVGWGQGQPAPPPDAHWANPGEVFKPGPVPVAGPGELAPCGEETGE